MEIVLAVLGAIASLPKIIEGFKSLVAWLEKTFGPNWPARVEELRTASEKWQAAQTDQERTDAAQAMARAFNSRS